MSMNVTKCILGKAASGIIDRDFAELNVKKLEEFESQLEFYPAASKEKALVDFANQLKHLSDIKKLQLLREVQAQDRIITQISTHSQGKVKGLMATLTHDLAGRADGLNVDKLRESIRAISYGSMPDAVIRLSLKNLGLSQDKKLATNVVRAIFGDTNNETATIIARQFRDVMEDLRNRFNAAGGDIPNLDNFHLPQNHDSRLLNNVNSEEWVKFITPLLDHSKMIDNATGWPLSQKNLQKLLEESYETLRTKGLNKLDPGKPHNLKLANKYNNSRILHFKDAESWLTYNQRFGNDDIYKTMVDHIDNMSNDIAFLEIWGPNPEHLKRFAIDTIRKDAGISYDEKLKNKTTSQLHNFEVLWDDVSGNSAIPANTAAAKVNSEIRALMMSAQLGGAFLSQFSDLVTNSLTVQFNGLSKGELLKNYMRLMTGNQYRDFAIHLGLGADELTRILSSTQRHADGILSSGKMAKVSNVIMRASLLERMTMASKKAFELDFVSTLGKAAKDDFSKLPKGLQQAFKRYSLTENDWNIIRKSKLDNFNGAKYVNLISLSKENIDVANKLQNLILTERDFAVIDSNPRSRALLIGNSKAGTFWGETRRYFGMYKTFPLTVLMHHVSRMIALDSVGSRLGYAAALFVPMTLMGYLSVQAKTIAAGKKPLPADNWKTWLASASQGGGAGILGDFLFADESRSGNSIVASLVGPGGSLIEDVWGITGKPIKQAIAEEDTNYPSEIIAFVKRYTPGNNLWYTKLAIERTIFDQASLALDPKAKKRFRRLQRQQNKDFKNGGYWWKPGSLQPEF